MKILLLGDIVGPAGMEAVMSKLPSLIDRMNLNFVVANGENAADPGVGITENRIYARILGYDEFGVWMKHPKFRIPKPNVKSKRKKQSFQNVEASILIPWGFIASIVHFPNVEGFDFPNPFEKNIGFEKE